MWIEYPGQRAGMESTWREEKEYGVELLQNGCAHDVAVPRNKELPTVEEAIRSPGLSNSPFQEQVA